MKHWTASPKTVTRPNLQYGIQSKEFYPETCAHTLASLPQSTVGRGKPKKGTELKNLIYLHHNQQNCGPRQHSRYSDSLRARRSGDRISMEARLSALVQTGPRDHPAFCTKGTGSLSWGVKWPGRGADHPPALVKVKVKQSRYRPGVAQRVPGS